MKVTVSGQQDGRQGEMGLLYSTSNTNTIEFASDNRPVINGTGVCKPECRYCYDTTGLNLISTSLN